MIVLGTELSFTVTLLGTELSFTVTVLGTELSVIFSRLSFLVGLKVFQDWVVFFP